MSRHIAGIVVIAVCSCPPLRAEQRLPQPSSRGVNFDGAALRFECVAALKGDGEDRLIRRFRAKNPSGRRTCLAQLLQSLTPEPDFTAEDFQRSLRLRADGDYDLRPPEALNQKMTDRMSVNERVAQGLEALADHGLIDGRAALRPLIDCLRHPLLDVAVHCNDALMSLTRHTHGRLVFSHFGDSLPFTAENRDRAIAEWTALDQQLATGRPVFDASLRAACRNAFRAMGVGLVAALQRSPLSVMYLRSGRTNDISQFDRRERIAEFDVGDHNAANWSHADPVRRVAILLFRPGLPGEALHLLPDGRDPFAAPTYRESFPALDLELLFVVETSDEAMRQAATLAVHDALAGLRAVDAHPLGR